jgi:hypothetical protein
MSTVKQFSEKDRAYHAYQARQNYLRQQKSIARHIQALEAEQMRERAEKERERTEKERERAAKEEVLAEIERLKALLKASKTR